MSGTPAAQCDYDVFTVAMNTSIGTQALVGDCGGKTPKGGVVIATRATAVGDTPVHGALLSLSLWDASGNVCTVANMAETGAAVAAANAGRSQDDTNIVQILATDAPTIDGEAAFDSVSADTLTIDITDAPTTAVILEVWLFYGDTLEAHVGQLAASAIVGTEVTETGIPFTPRALFALSAPGGFAAGLANNARGSFGVCAFNEAVGGSEAVQGQCGMALFVRDTPTATSATGGGFRTDSMLQRITVSGTGVLSEEARYEVTGLTSDGFKVTTRAGANGTAIGYLALFTGKLRAWVDNPSLGLTSVGAKSITDTGFRPRFLACLGSRQTTDNAYVSDSQSLHFGVGAAVSGAQASASFHTQDQATPNSLTRGTLDDTLMTIVTTVGGEAIDWAATLISFDSTGFTVIVLPASGADRQVGFLALEDGSSPGWLDARSGHRWRRCLARR